MNLGWRRDDFGFAIKPLTTDGIHQWMNPWVSVATNRRDGNSWGLLIAGLVWAAMSRPPDLLRRR
jgi:hypothetical protein